MLPVWLFMAVWAGFTAPGLRAAGDPPAELILRGGTSGDKAKDKERGQDILTPSAAFELRCAEPMVAPERVGTEETPSPVVLIPPLAGSFRWTSQRGGVFTPSAPPVLGTVFHAVVRPGLLKADGRPLGAEDVHATYYAPPMEAHFGGFLGAFNKDDLAAKPKVQLFFNAPVDPDKITPFLKFQDAAGSTVPALAALPGKNDGQSPETTTPHRTWNELFFAAHAPADDKVKTAPVVNRVVVTPAQMLPVGEKWTLVAAPGLPGTDPGVKLSAASKVVVGRVRPFVVDEVKAENSGENDRQITVSFSKEFSKEITDENAGKWVHVTPAPENLKITREPSGGPHLYLNGDFQVGQPYEVTVEAAFPSRRPYALAETYHTNLHFSAEPPLVSLPDYSTHQLSGGRRVFAMLTRNAPEIRVRAKLVPTADAPKALIAYQAEYMNHNDETTSSQKRMDFDKVPGKVIYEKLVPGSKSMDKPETIPLKWDDILGERRNGVVLLEVEQPTPTRGQTKRAGAQALVQVTDLGAVWKTSHGGECLAYAFSLTDTHPAAEATVRVLDAKGASLGAAKADGDGLAKLPGGLLENAAWLSVSTGDDCHVIAFGNGERSTVSTYGFHLPPTAYADDPLIGEDTPATPEPRRTILFFSDRGVYKPGETAQVKATVREWRGGALATPAPTTTATLRAYDARGRKFWQKEAALSATGSITETVPLPKTTLGLYRVMASFHPAGTTAAKEESDNGDLLVEDEDDEDNDPPGTGVCRFQVQEFQPNPFEVTLKKPDAPVGAGSTPVVLAAHYYMGKTLSQAKAVWSLKADDIRFAPAGFDEYNFCTGQLDYRMRRERGELSLDGRAALGADGTLTLSPNIVLNEAQPAPRKVNLQASVTDQDQQTVSAHARYTVHSSDFYLGLREFPDVVHAGDPLPVEVVAVGARDEQPLPAPVRVTAKLSRIEWRTNRIANDTGDSDYDSKPHLLPVATVDLDTTEVRKLGKQWEPATEMAALADPGAVRTAPAVGKLLPTDPGEYFLELTAQDKNGRQVLTSTTFSALGDKEAEWGYRNAWQAQLVPDRVEYTPGQTATVLIKTPISGRALVTVEREGVSRAFVTDIAKTRPAVQIPILPGDAPNVFVSVLLVRGSGQSTRRVKQPEYRAGYCQLLVPKADARVAVEVKPAKPEYQPGDGVDVQVDVTDAVAHGPIAGAEVTLYAVDKGVLSLTGYKTPEPLRTFYRPRPLDVLTGLTIPNLLSEDPEDMNFSSDKGSAANKGYLVGGGGGEGRGDRLRQNFVACAYWNAALVTDARGRVSAHFQAPDGLTEYQVMAVVNQGAGRFGSGEGAFRINKPVMLEPAMPRFGNVGDHMVLRAVVHNQSGAAGEAEVTIDLDDKATVVGADGQTTDQARVRRVPLAAGESKAVEFPVEFQHTGQAVWTWRARLVGSGPGGQAWRDSVRTTLNVDHPTPRRSEVAYVRAEGERTDDLLGKINPELLEGEDGTVQVSLSTSRLSELRESVDELLHYPYGCVEQTTSSLLPWLALKDFGDALPDLRHTPEEAEEAVSRGVNKLLSMQTESGGLAYWPGDSGRDAHPWGSAYGALGMALTKRAGFFVPQANLDKLCQYLSNRLRSDDKDAHDTYHEHNTTDRCLALYALALAGKGEPAYDEQFYNRREKMNAEDRALVALAIVENKGPAEMVKALLQPMPQDKATTREWDEFANPATVDGMRLLAWCRFQPHDPAIDEKLSALLDERESRGGWQTTQGNAWALLAMSAYAREVEKAGEPAAGSVTLAGQTREFQLAGNKRSFACDFPLSLATGGKLAVVKTAGRKLYVQAKVESRPRGGAGVNAQATVGSADYSIVRRYEKVLDDGHLTDEKNWKVGDRILVSLDIQAPRGASYVAVNDPLPAVLEAINPEFKTQDAGAVKSDDYGWWTSDFKELREDRAVFFRDHLYAGRFRLQYLARVRAAGTATAPAAKIEEMYHPDRFAETAAGKVSSSPLD